ncbi:hypothetical protein [Litoribrevibacter albus]|uniref:ABM domain-containing protein n=1 Tax=Litoribrevibacter albus TaxID=1473156 RepID=A0AA37S7W7_9GAMM|nr:hypothetical protein [Litoribrevibacter albus]GLQ29568.1 hypothetical protein GCM10007876_00460 [Litoribrevibacter albus]
MSQSQKEALEVCLFKLTEDTEKQAFMEANGELDQWLKAQDGFMFRCLSEKEDGTWIDIIHWASKEAANKAGDGFMETFKDSDFMRAIDPDTVNMNHAQVEVAYPAG